MRTRDRCVWPTTPRDTEGRIKLPELAIFTDASDKNGVVGIGVTRLAQSGTTWVSKTIGHSGAVSVHTAELIINQEPSRWLIDSI